MDARALRHDLERSPLSLVRPRGPRVLGVWLADDEVAAAELVEQRAVFVRRLIDAARMGEDRADPPQRGRRSGPRETSGTRAPPRPRDRGQSRPGTGTR